MIPRFKSMVLTLLGSVVITGCQILPEKAEQPSIQQPRESRVLDAKTLKSRPQAARTDFSSTNAINSKPPAPTRPADLWQITRSHFSLNLTQSRPRIETQLNWYKKHPRYISRVVKRASRYYHYVLHETIKRGMPAELALLPIVESAYDPFAYSHGRAAGPWQFIPSTGKYFGLKQTWWYDGRRDVIASTQAALDYLQQLHRRFDSWELALAAYNAGGGNVSRAIKRNRRQGKATDYWSLKLPTETMAYVPKLLAIAKLVKTPEAYGQTLDPLENTAYFTAVNTRSQLDLAQAAELAGTSTKELYLLNPGFNRWATDPEGPHRLLIPIAKAEQFRNNLAALPADQRVKWTRHKIKSGESLISIARDYQTTVAVVRTANNLKDSSIRAGKTLMIPTASQRSGEYVLSQAQRLNRKQQQIARRTQRQKNQYTVKNGDSFWVIARKHKVELRQLASWNNMAPGDPLRIGKKLIIWTDQKATLSNNDRQIIRKIGYKVRNGDSLARIAGRFNVSVSNILRWNKLDVKKYLKPGQKLTLYIDVTRSG
ncbi:MAG: LysM peptidoglycan-binding domain-containing protein [Pontibacterium sp.]